MADDFTAARDFPPGSMPWLREAEDRTKGLEDKVELLLKNLRSLSRSNAAGMKATHLRISALQGTNIPPGTPINIQIYPYAYFTPSGYPAGGAHIYWGDQNDADKYEIWIRRVTAPDSDEYSDFYLVQGTQIGTADVRGLEVMTEYELMIRAVSPGGSYGFFTGVHYFTTPNETTLIPWLGDPIVTWHPGGEFASIQWQWSPDYQPAYTTISDTVVNTGAVTGTIPPEYWGNHAVGVLASNGKIYYPPGRGYWLGLLPSPSNASKSRGLILDPETNTFTLSDYNLPEMLDYGATGSSGSGPGFISGGVLGDDGWIYWLARVTIENDPSDLLRTYILRLHPDSSTAEAIDTGVSTIYSFMAKGGNGKIYCMPKGGPDEAPFLVITTAGTSPFTFSMLGFTPIAGQDYGQGAADANGDVWFMPLGNLDTTPDFLVFRIAGGSATVELVPRPPGVVGPIHAPVLAENGNLYCFSWASSPSPSGLGTTTWIEITPDGEMTTGTLTNTAKLFQGVVDPSGRIRFAGAGSTHLMEGNYGNNVFNNAIPWFDPETKASGRTTIAFGSQWPIDQPVLGPNGTIYMRVAPGQATTTEMSGMTTQKFATLHVEVTEHPETGTAEIPNYLKHMQVQRSTESGWQTVGTLAEPGGFVMDPFAQLGAIYRLMPISTAGTPGTPSADVILTS